MQTFQKITLNTLASSAGRVIGSFIALLSIGFITRSLGREGFGEYATILAYLSTFQILADLGLYSLFTREISQNPEDEKRILGDFFTLRLFTAVIFLFVGVLLVFVFPYSPHVKIGVVFTSSAFLFMSLSQILMGVFQKYLQIYKTAISEVFGRLTQLGFVWFFFSLGGNFYYYLGALVLGSFVIFLLNFIFAWRLVSFRLTISVNRWRKILKTALPIAISLVFTLLYFKMDTIFISVLKPQTDVGIYSVAYKVLETMIFFPAVFIGLLFPILAKYACDDRKKLSNIISNTTNLITFAAVPVVVGGVMLSSSIVYFIGGSQFLISTLVMQVLFFAVGVIFYGTLFGSSAIALGLQKKAMWAYIAGFIFNFATNIIFIPKYSYMGAAWTTVATEILVTLILVWIVRREILFRFSYLTTIKVALSATLMGVGVFYFATPLSKPLSIIQFLSLVILGFVIYISILGILDRGRLRERVQIF